ncbi:MAG TPA: cytochrome P460 family protein [Aggregatilineales bacterium]|nr:cytochrome P460 family protein [Aggregatilineales bacterium]
MKLKPAFFYISVGLLVIGIAIIAELSTDSKSPAEADSQTPLILSGKIPTVVYAEGEYPPGRDPMALPENYRIDLIHYATIDRIDGISRNLYITPAAIDALRSGEPVPERTMIVIEAFTARRNDAGTILRDENGHFIQDVFDPEVHASEMRTTWRIEDMHTTSASGDWNFAAFNLDNGESLHEGINDCFSCHEAAFSRDFVFTRPILMSYVRTGTVQYSYCPRPDRAICR